MISLQVQNNQLFRTNEIPFLSENDFYNSVLEGLSNSFRMIGLFPISKDNTEKIVAILADSGSSAIHLTGGIFDSGKKEFVSLANKYPQTNYFECELAEKHKFSLKDHPWHRPVRKQKVISGDTPYQFYKLDGDEVHEVAVGPIHAGVIEPGHFRFQCHGETVYHLEINLGYQHRGIESQMLTARPRQRIVLAESIAGDTVIGHTYAHCAAVEALSNTQITLRAQTIRTIAEELERAAMHLSSLGGIANDIGFAIVASSYGRIRTLVINSLSRLCGSRFGRGLFNYGGIRFDFTEKILEKVLTDLNIVKRDAEAISNVLFTSNGALLRFDDVGTVTQEQARQTGMVGIAARSSNIETDTRIHFPYGAYRYSPISLIHLQSGDVFARGKIRAMELEESLKFVIEQIENLPSGDIMNEKERMASESGVVSIVEGWRGEIVHSAFTDDGGEISMYKIKDPSFNNWYGLGLALRRTPISDFPLCNKSFDLSYSGHDL